MAFDEASALAVRTQWGNMVTCASITLLPQNRNINYPTKLIVIYSNICCAVDWSGVISPKALWQKKLYFGSSFRGPAVVKSVALFMQGAVQFHEWFH